MKMVMILAMVGVITLIVCAMLAFAFFFVGMIDELGVEDKVHEAGERFGRYVKGKVCK